MEKIDYTGKYFRESMPEWKRKKDPFTVHYIYRPISFYVAAWCARHNISANTVSYTSALVAIAAAGCFIINDYYCHIAGAILSNVWMLMDCVDGNLARTVKKQPFGAFADAMSSYILVAFICLAMGFAAYQEGGILVQPGCIWIVLVGALASISDTLMRLIYQKYKNVEHELEKAGILIAEIDERQDVNQSTNWKNKIDETFGIGGIMQICILLSAIFHALDLMVLYCFAFFGSIALVAIVSLVRKAIRRAKENE